MANVETREELMGRIARTVARKFGRRHFWADLRDLEQQAWEGVLIAAARHDPGMGPLERWLRVSACQHLSLYVVQASTPVKVPRGKGIREAEARGFAGLRSVPMDEDTLRHGEQDGSPEAQLEAAQLHAMVERVIREAIRRHDQTGLAQEVLIGGKRPAEVAQKHGTPVKLVYAATASTRAKLRTDPEMLRLRRMA